MIRYFAILYLLAVSLFNMYGEILPFSPNLYYLGNSLVLAAFSFSVADKVSLKASKMPFWRLKIKYIITRAFILTVAWYNVLLSVFNTICLFMGTSKTDTLIDSAVNSGISIMVIFVSIILFTYGRLDQK